MTTCKYTELFIKNAKAVYPDWPDLHRMLDSNNYFAGRLLSDEAEGELDPEKVFRATSLDEVKKMALELIKKKHVYYQWQAIACK